jgi:hypothetical protein
MPRRVASDPNFCGAPGRFETCLIVLAWSIFAILLAPSMGLAQSVGGTTHAEFTLSHWEEVGGGGGGRADELESGTGRCELDPDHG